MVLKANFNYDIIKVTYKRGGEPLKKDQSSRDKLAALEKRHALNPQPEKVIDPAFVSGGDFFDARDLVQVKYEMLRRVQKDGQSVKKAAAAFGFSRPSFYRTQQAFMDEGLPGLLPERPGPRRGHKLTPEVITFLDQIIAKEPLLGAKEMAVRIQTRFNLAVHPRSIARYLARRLKKLPRREY
jgi:transposase